MDTCLIYFSSSLTLSEEDLVALLHQSRKHNSRVGITGVLLFVRGHIVQVLEGDKQAVEALYERIKQDTKHTNVSLAINRPISQRLFAKWAMGYETITHQQLEEIKAIVNLDRSERSAMILSESPILRALQVFYDGNRHN